MTAVSATALVLEALFLALAFGWRTVLQYRRTGDWGVRRPATAAARTASALMIVGFAAAGSAPVVDLFGLAPGRVVNAWGLGVAGLVVLAASIAGTLQAQLALGASWRIGVDPDESLQLVTGGPFRFVRNPIFAWMLAAAIGMAFAVPNALAILGAVLVVAGVELQVRLVEEPYLRRLHGAGYLRYAAGVGRFLPGVGRLRA